jgi:tetratricopeptide (TPR) repeat protein/protein involved in polysaccharide export with SLBB domain
MKKIFLLGFVVCALGSVGAGATMLQDGGRADIYYRDGTRFALEGRLVEAANAFEQAVTLDPTDGNAFYSLGNVYSELGRWADAVNAYDKAISLNKGDVEAYNALGIALGRRGQYGQAAAAFERAIKIYPKWAEPYFHLSQVRRELGREDEAQAAYNQALRLRPDYAEHPPRTLMNAGTKADTPPPNKKTVAGNPVAADVGLPEHVAPPSASATRDAGAPAIVLTPAKGETASKAARLNSVDARAYYDFGVKQSRAGRYEEAVEAFRQAILLDRKNAEAYLALGDAYAAQGSWRDSVDAYEQAARLNPDDAETYQRLGRSYAKLREMSPRPETGDGAATVGVKTAAPSGATADAEQPSLKNSLPGSGVEPSGGNATPRAAPSKPDAAAPAPVAAEDELDPTAVYRVGPGDVLDIRVLKGRERRMTSYEVTPTGLLVYPTLSEPLQVAGLTTEQVSARLGSALKLRAAGADPEIAVGVREYVSHAIIVSGMVKDAGTKILQREGVPLYVIIAYAQPLPEAGQALIFARSTGRSMAIDLSDARAMKILVRPGDVITLRPRPEQYFYVAGAVRQPGQKKFHAGLTLTQAVLTAGGLSTPGAGVVVIARQVGDSPLTTTRYDLKEIGAGRLPDPSVQAGDRIEVLR